MGIVQKGFLRAFRHILDCGNCASYWPNEVCNRVDLLKKVRKSKARDDEVIKAVEEIKQAEVKMLRNEKWKEKDGLMLKERKVYVPKDKELRTEIIWLHHDTLVGGHEGQ